MLLVLKKRRPRSGRCKEGREKGGEAPWAKGGRSPPKSLLLPGGFAPGLRPSSLIYIYFSLLQIYLMLFLALKPRRAAPVAAGTGAARATGRRSRPPLIKLRGQEGPAQPAPLYPSAGYF